MSSSRIPTTNASFDETDDTERQRREIESTRSDMGHTLERIEDRVSPSRIKERRTERMRGRVQRVRQSVMGDDEGPGTRGRLSGATDDARQTMREAPDRMQETARGNPLAAGLIAFGLGALAGSVLPVSPEERRVAGRMRAEFEEPVREELQHAGKDVGGSLREEAKQAADDLASSAQDAARRTKDDARSSTERVKDEATGDGASQTDLPPAPPRT